MVSPEDLLEAVSSFLNVHQMDITYSGENKSDLNGVPRSQQVLDEISRVMEERRVDPYSALDDCLWNRYTLELENITSSFSWEEVLEKLESQFPGISATYVSWV
jgi:hypothetical protein